jgi:tetratricopeptide (TPR) repeat protein
MQQDIDGQSKDWQIQIGEIKEGHIGDVIHNYLYEPRASATGIPHNLPYSGVTQFVGREAELKQLHQQLQTGTTIAISSISGMGGIGKTELALQYAYQHLKLQTYPGSICWLRAREDLGIQIVSFAQTRLDLFPPEDLELAEKVTWCWRHWQQGKVLVVLDDVQDYQNIRSLLPAAESRFRIVLTTRLRLGSPIQNLEIEVLTLAASLDLLRSLVTDGRIDQQIDEAKQICEWLGYLPLGLELVGRYLARKPDTSLTTLCQRLQDKRLEAKALKDAEPEMTASLGVTAAFELSWEALSESAQQLAALLSLFALAEIPWTLVEAFVPEEEAEELEDLRDEQLVNWYLLQRTKAGMYQLHQLLREFFAAKRAQIPVDEDLKQAFCQIIAVLARQIPSFSTQSQIEQFAPTIPHLEETATTLHPWLTDADIIMPFTRIAQFYNGQAAYKEATLWYQHCLEIAETRLGVNHSDVAIILNNLASLYESQGRYSEAEPLYTRSLSIIEQHLGTDHPDVATSLNNLAGLYKLQGRYNKTEFILLQSINILEQQMEANHPRIATSLNGLAGLYYLQGRYSEAEPLFMRSLAIREQQLGTTHPDVATSLNNLASLYKLQGRYSKAEPLYLQTLAILMNLSENHPHTQTAWDNFWYLVQQAVEAGQTAQLSDHPLTQYLLQQIRGEECNNPSTTLEFTSTTHATLCKLKTSPLTNSKP